MSAQKRVTGWISDKAQVQVLIEHDALGITVNHTQQDAVTITLTADEVEELLKFLTGTVELIKQEKKNA